MGRIRLANRKDNFLIMLSSLLQISSSKIIKRETRRKNNRSLRREVSKRYNFKTEIRR